MKKLKIFFTTFKKSLLKPDYYKQVIKAPFSFSLKYFLFLFFIIGIFNSIAIYFVLTAKVQPYFKDMGSKIPDLYPPKLVINIKNGRTAINLPEPYFIPLKPEVFPADISRALKKQPIQNILVIDTKAEPSEIRKYQTFAFLNRDSISFMPSHDQIRIQSLEKVPDFTLNRQTFNRAWEKITSFLKRFIPIFSLVFFFLLPLLLISTKFSYLFFISLISWLLAKSFKYQQINYKKALQINLQAITLPTVITSLFYFFGASVKIPFFQSIILLLFNLIIFLSLREKK